MSNSENKKWTYRRFEIYTWLQWGWAFDEWSLLFSIDVWEDGFSLYFLCFWIDFGGKEMMVVDTETSGLVQNSNGHHHNGNFDHAAVSNHLRNNNFEYTKRGDENSKFSDRFQVRRRP